MNISDSSTVLPQFQNNPSNCALKSASFFHGREVEGTLTADTEITGSQQKSQSSPADSKINSRSITDLPETESSQECKGEGRIHEVTITDLGKTLDIESLWEEIDYYLERLIKIDPRHLAQLKKDLEVLTITEFQFFEDLIDHLVSNLNEKEGIKYPLMDEINEDINPDTGNKKGVKLLRLGKYITAALVVDSGLNCMPRMLGAEAAPIPNNGTSLSRPDDLTLSYRFISDSGFRNVITKPGSSPIPVLADTCISQTPHSSSQLTEGEAICIPDGDDTSYYFIGESDKQKSIAISTGHGRGDLSVFVDSGQLPDISAEPTSSQAGNKECVVLENPDQYWTTIAVKGHKEKASLAVDFNSDTCRLPVRRGFTETHVRTNGYPYKSAHLLVYKLNFADDKLDWPKLEEDLQGAREYYKRQSYDNFDVSWEIVEVNLGESIQKYNNGTYHDWRVRRDEVLRRMGVNPDQPGRDNLILVASPSVANYNSVGGRASMTIYDKHSSVGAIVHEMGHAMGLRHAKALESGNEVIRDMPDDETWYRCNRNKTCVDARNQYLQDYGNVYDLMGMAGSGDYPGEMNLLYKSFFGWLDLDNDVPMVMTSGKYRIHAFDHADKSHGPIGLRLPSGDGKYTYWLEYRTTGSHSENSKGGLLINLEGYAEHDTDPEYWRTTSYLLDMTPESKNSTSPNWWGDDYTDAALTIGETYTDKWGGFRIRPNWVGGEENSANAFIEVEVVTREAMSDKKKVLSD